VARVYEDLNPALFASIDIPKTGLLIKLIMLSSVFFLFSFYWFVGNLLKSIIHIWQFKLHPTIRHQGKCFRTAFLNLFGFKSRILQFKLRSRSEIICSWCPFKYALFLSVFVQIIMETDNLFTMKFVFFEV